MSVRGKVEEFAISAKHRPSSVFNRVARLAERGELYVRYVCLPEIEQATPVVIHWLRRKRSHLAIAKMVRAEFVKRIIVELPLQLRARLLRGLPAEMGLSK